MYFLFDLMYIADVQAPRLSLLVWTLLYDAAHFYNVEPGVFFIDVSMMEIVCLVLNNQFSKVKVWIQFWLIRGSQCFVMFSMFLNTVMVQQFVCLSVSLTTNQWSRFDLSGRMWIGVKCDVGTVRLLLVVYEPSLTLVGQADPISVTMYKLKCFTRMNITLLLRNTIHPNFLVYREIK